MPQIKPDVETFAKIKVVGVGGSGGAAIHRMMSSKIQGVDFVAVNTDAQALHHCQAPKKIHVGRATTRGLGAGMNPDIGRQAAEESREEIEAALKGSDMVFITCGMGGGTGTGASVIVAEAAKESGALTVAVITRPFSFEGLQRSRIAEAGIEELRDRVDTMIIVPNDRLLTIIDRKTSLVNAFEIVDDVLRQAVQGISDLITMPGIVNVDFADVKAIMKDAGSALMGIGRATGDDRAQEAARAAINSPLLEVSINGAKGVLFNVSGGSDLSMSEVNEAAQIITESVDRDAKIIFGAVIDDKLKKGEIKITVVATGFSNPMPQSSSMLQAEGARGTEAGKLFRPRELPLSLLRPEKEDITESVTIKSKPKDFESQISSLAEDEEDSDDEFVVPAFIRRKMK